MDTDRRKKTLQELTFKDNFMFAAVMMDEENARGVLERILDRKIGRIDVSYEKSIVYNPEYKGVRLDVHVVEGEETHFSVEMQVVSKKILRRARYYHDQIDMEILLSGAEYETMPDSYVIFICDFDPFGLGMYRYIRRQTLKEAPDYDYEDGSHTIFLSTKGKNDDGVSKELVDFLHFAGAELNESRREYADDFVRRLQKSIEKIRHDREMGRRYMLFEELMKDEFKAGKAEGKAEGISLAIIRLLGRIADVPDQLRERISSVRDIDVLSSLLEQAVTVTSIHEFEDKLKQMNL